ncbi:aldolase/citrate lyase family protein [Collinsella ihumii]|uniref:Aldolase/citrate lyase family protein n=1 Tax=Collinsella ihumii TaxID=1720204 RepID=A0ABT7XH33_9ACTN|nr:aldolase/citrate lyase family protein [Collinsella ihumii]MDN0064694.1 aldolase/citrate lyase family protein [Collinsella ihumii]
MADKITRPRPKKDRLRRTMMFMNAQRPGLIKDAYIYGVDSIILDLEDAVAVNQKDAARFSLYHALTTIDYGDTEVIVRINGLDTEYWQEDVRVCVAGGADGIRIAKCESADMVRQVEAAVEAAEREFGVEVGRTLLIASKEARFTQDPRELMMAKNAADVIAALPYFKNGFSFQTGVGGPSLAVNRFLEDHMREENIKMGFALGGASGAICNLLDKGLVGKIIDVQDFDQTAINHLANNPNHVEMSQSEYANPGSKGSFVNYLDYMVLSALEIDTKFNVNVVTGSDGVVRGAPGGHPDTAATSKCCIIVTPLVRGRMPVVCKDVTTVTTPGECVDVLVTDYGTAVNPARTDIIECLDAAGIPHVSIESLQEKAYSIVGEPDPLQWEDKVVAIVEARDDTILDVIRQIKPYDFE